MPISRMNEKVLGELKRKIKQLEKTEAQHRKKLKRAILDASKAAKTYKAKFKKKIDDLKSRHAVEKAAACARSALDAERKIVSDAEKLCKELTAAIVRMDKKHLKRIVKNVAKKAKNSTLVSRSVAKKKRKPAKKRKQASLRRKVSVSRKAVKR